MPISTIIPILNEEKVLSKNSSSLLKLSRETELIFVDGGSSDKSVSIASKLGSVLTAPKGRSFQMNKGASCAKNKILLFLHADNIIEPETIESIENILLDKAYVGGCLSQSIDSQRTIFRLIEGFGNMRARLTKVFYGDQGIFVKKNVFFRIGKFPDVPIMEDVLFAKKIRRRGKTLVLKDKIIVSPRRWEKRGILRTVFLYSKINILFYLKTPLDRIKNIYKDLR